MVPQARGRGIGAAAIVQLVEFGLVRDNLRRIHLQAIASNAGAIRAYRKAGFVVEGRQREHAWVRGAYEDMPGHRAHGNAAFRADTRSLITRPGPARRWGDRRLA